MPLYNVLEDDKQIWRYSHNGFYTVKSAYHNIMNSIIDNICSPPSAILMIIYAGLGAIFRDHLGGFLGCLSSYIGV